MVRGSLISTASNRVANPSWRRSSVIVLSRSLSAARTMIDDWSSEFSECPGSRALLTGTTPKFYIPHRLLIYPHRPSLLFVYLHVLSLDFCHGLRRDNQIRRSKLINGRWSCRTIWDCESREGHCFRWCRFICSSCRICIWIFYIVLDCRDAFQSVRASIRPYKGPVAGPGIRVHCPVQRTDGLFIQDVEVWRLSWVVSRESPSLDLSIIVHSKQKGLPAPVVGATLENASLFVSYRESQNVIRHLKGKDARYQLPLGELMIAAGAAGLITSFILWGPPIYHSAHSC